MIPKKYKKTGTFFDNRQFEYEEYGEKKRPFGLDIMWVEEAWGYSTIKKLHKMGLGQKILVKVNNTRFPIKRIK